MMGAAVATLAAYLVLFLGMWVRSRQVYPVAYQWRRIITLAVGRLRAHRDRLGSRLAARGDRRSRWSTR